MASLKAVERSGGGLYDDTAWAPEHGCITNVSPGFASSIFSIVDMT